MGLLLVAAICIPDDALAQSSRKKIRLSLSSTTVALLPTFAAHDKGFFRDEGFDVEIIHMPATLASTALMTGDLDYNGAVRASVQLLIDLARESAKVARAIRIDKVVDFSFVDRARRELGLAK